MPSREDSRSAWPVSITTSTLVRLLDPTQRLDAVHSRHADVEDDDVHRLIAEDRERFGSLAAVRVGNPRNRRR